MFTILCYNITVLYKYRIQYMRAFLHAKQASTIMEMHKNWALHTSQGPIFHGHFNFSIPDNPKEVI